MSPVPSCVLLLVLASPPGVPHAAPVPEAAVEDKAPAAAPQRKPAGRAAGAAPAPAAEAPRSQEEIQGTFDAGDYAGALKQVSRVINLKGEAAAGYDRYALWMLKGESHLRLKQLKQAGEAFAAAAKETQDDAEAAKARATRQMVAEAKAYQVKRRALGRGEKPQSADILDPDQREQALRILYEDAKVQTGPVVKAALKARELPPIARALEVLAGARDLELAATGGEGELATARDDVARRARELIERELSDMRENVETIRKEANQTIERRRFVDGRRTVDRDYGPRVVRGRSAEESRRNNRRDMRRREGVYARDESDGDSVVTIVKRGLTNQDKEDLRTVVKQCLKILPTLDGLTEASGADVDEFEDLVKSTKEVGTLAERTLNDRYRDGD